MALDPKIYDVDAYQKAADAWNAKNRKLGKQGKPFLNVSTAPTGAQFLRPGQKAPPGSGTPDVTGYDPRFGGIPGVPNPVASAGEAVAGNLANFEDLARLTGRTNELMFGQYTGRLPGYSDLAAASSGNIAAQLRGELPQDVINLIGQQAAERGIGAGVSGSQFSNADYLRSLGLTSLAQKQAGETAFTGAMGRLQGIPTFDPSTMFTRPEDVYGAGLQRNIFASAPLPSAANAYNQQQATLPFQEAENRRRAAESNKQGKWISNPNFGIGDLRGQIWSG